jgi:hypothetical protein
MQGPEGRPPNVSPARNGRGVHPELDPSAVGAALNRLCHPERSRADLQFRGPLLGTFSTGRSSAAPSPSPSDRNVQLVTFPQFNGVRKINRHQPLAPLQARADRLRSHLRRSSRARRSQRARLARQGAGQGLDRKMNRARLFPLQGVSSPAGPRRPEAMEVFLWEPGQCRNMATISFVVEPAEGYHAGP